MKAVSISTFLLAILLVVGACNEKDNPEQLFELMDAEQVGIGFVNKITESDSVNVLEFMNVYTGGGVAVGDVNHDSLPDLFFSGNMVSSKLYINKSTKDALAFEDVTDRAGVGTNQWITGVTMVDVNQDGLLDIYACASGSKNAKQRENKLYINQGLDKGVPRFKESGEAYGLNDDSYSTHSAFFDYDRDGDLDVFLIENVVEEFFGNKANLPQQKEQRFDSLRTNRLYKNTYAEQRKGQYAGQKQFIDVSREAGITDAGYYLGLSVSDVNNDGWPDVYATSDFLPNDLLYINNRNGTFSNKAAESLKHTSYSGMGVDIADFNNDERTDIAVVDMVPEDNFRLKSMMNTINYDRFVMDLRQGYTPQFSRNTLQLNNGPTAGTSKLPDVTTSESNRDVSFSEISPLAGIHHTDWSWSVLFGDYDNDGWKDIFITNGFLRDMQNLDFVRDGIGGDPAADGKEYKKQFLKLVHDLPAVKVRNYLYKNRHDLTFQNMTEPWGITQPSVSNGAAYTDLDNDGDLDLVVSNINESPFIYKNRLTAKSKAANFLKISFAGAPGNRDGIGAKVEIKAAGLTQVYENYLTRGFESSIGSTIHAGLGNHTRVEELTITWPDGKVERLKNVKANTHLLVHHTNAKAPQISPSVQRESLFTEVAEVHQIDYRHQENYYSDFDMQRLLPFKLSQSGPGLAVGDIDGNGTDDFYIGGSANAPGTVFRQNKNGTFRAQPLPEKDAHEDTGSLLFDADRDGDLDLYVVSGGVEKYAEAPFNYSEGPFYQDRLYRNDGRGNFTEEEGALPKFDTSGSCVTAADFDKDGDLDLFVGGRSLPGQYPLPASSKILLNESKGKDKPLFRDVTAELLPALHRLGMVTSALWTDYNNDQWQDLLIVGEGMPIVVFENQQGKFKENATVVTNNLRGFWNSIVSGDFDSDGDLDYVVGNMGLNSLLKTSKEQPVCIYAKDFDRNGSLDPVLCYYLLGENVPFHPRDVFVEQMNIMRGIYPSYAEYASAKLGNLFNKDTLAKAYALKYENFQTSLLQNNGRNGFLLKPFATEAQISTTNGMLVDDFDGDGIADLMMVGNSYAPAPTIGWYDASIGSIFKGKGDGSFTALNQQKTGFYADKDAKAVAELMSTDNQPLILVSNNADSLQVFTYRNKPTTVVALNPMDAGAEITYNDGRTVKAEFYYGSGYLSQSTRHLKISDKIKSVTIYDYSGNKRSLYPPKLAEVQ